jgi:hypothetical protein
MGVQTVRSTGKLYESMDRRLTILPPSGCVDLSGDAMWNWTVMKWNQAYRRIRTESPYPELVKLAPSVE